MAEAIPRVLVVDDERFFREAIVDTLGEAGVACEGVADAAALRTLIRDPQVGVLLLDVALADPTCAEILEFIREERPGLRVIAVSSQTDHESVLEALRAGACDYLAKPLHDEELLLTVRRALSAYDADARWSRLRARLRNSGARVTALAQEEDDGSEEALLTFAQRVVDGVAAVLDAEKTSLMLYDAETGELRVAAATGADRDVSAMDPVALGEGVAGVALSLGEALLVEDVYSDARLAQSGDPDRYATASLAVVPLRTATRALGVLCATDRAGEVPFGDDELALLQLLAVPAQHFLNRRAVALEAPPAAEPNLLGDADGEFARAVCAALVQEIEPGAILDSALQAASERLAGADVSICLIDNRSGLLQRERELAAEGSGDRPRLPRDRGLTGRVLQGGGAFAAQRPEQDDAFDPDVDTALDGEGRPFLCAPLELRGKVVGVLRAFPADAEAVSANTSQVLSTALSAAVRNILLYRSLLESIDELSEARREAGHLRLS